MATPRRALTSSLLRPIGNQTASRTAQRLLAPASSTYCLLRAPLSTVASRNTGRRATALGSRCPPLQLRSARYSTEGNAEGPPSRKWEFAEVKRQIGINAEMEKSGEEETTDGQHKVVFVDVREPHELHQTGKIPGAINIPITTAVQSFHISDEDFVDLYGFERPPKDAHLLFYCKAGIRARGAAGLAQHAGWTNIGDYPGSWIDWEAQKGPVEEVKKKV